VDALRLGFEPQALSIGLRPPPPSDRPSPQAASLRPARFLDHPVNPRKLCLGVRGIDSHGSARVFGSPPPACPQLHRKPPLTCRFCLAQRRYRPVLVSSLHVQRNPLAVLPGDAEACRDARTLPRCGLSLTGEANLASCVLLLLKRSRRPATLGIHTCSRLKCESAYPPAALSTGRNLLEVKAIAVRYRDDHQHD
jgi:hypothetical protein